MNEQFCAKRVSYVVARFHRFFINIALIETTKFIDELMPLSKCMKNKKFISKHFERQNQ